MHPTSNPSPDRDRLPATATDPVCGMNVNPATAAGSAVHEGRTYYFCNPSCLHRFQADPGRYSGGITSPAPPPSEAPAGTVYTCPMHPEVFRRRPGRGRGGRSASWAWTAGPRASPASGW
jgi:YHS domain-containing protein